MSLLDSCHQLLLLRHHLKENNDLLALNTHGKWIPSIRGVIQWMLSLCELLERFQTATAINVTRKELLTAEQILIFIHVF